MGELLPEQIRKQGERDQTLHDETFEKPKLSEMGIDRTESHRYQQIASVPVEKFEPTPPPFKRGATGNGRRQYCKYWPQRGQKQVANWRVETKRSRRPS